MGFLAGTASGASAETRSLKFYHLHTHEKAEIVYKRNGRYDQAGLKKINYILRDWRRDEPIKMDPRLLDLVWEAYRATGSHEYIQVICGYRSPATNSMLRSRSRGVAQKSQHMLGKALDFYIPGVPLKKLRDIGLKMQGGGVGYYPTSGSPFVHMDVGNVRHWPGISRQELARVFPNGKTLHVPSDGKPLPGYNQALAAYKARKSSGSPAIALASAGGGSGKSGGFLAAFFGGGADEEDDTADVASAEPAPKPKSPRATAPTAKSDLPGIAIVSPKDAKRVDIPQVADDEQAAEPAQETPETIIAALPAREIPLPGFAPRPKADVGAEKPVVVPFGLADASAVTAPKPSPVQTASIAGPQVNLPFGMAEPPAAADTAAADPVQVAVNNVPLPTWRPEPAAAPAELAPNDQQSVLLALADTAQRGGAGSDTLAMLPSPRPDEVKAVLDAASAEEYQVASLASAPRSVFSDPSGLDAASPRKAVAARPAGSDPASAIGGGVKTTRKEARASASDSRPEPKPMVVPAQPDAARWALNSNEQVATVSDATTAPRYAYNIVHTPPTEVYTVGFQPDGQALEANRFTGTAVKFLSVARFKAQ
jgi:uncharacterized protein YcbK (DUF882 family)